jgi:hypothetical protein
MGIQAIECKEIAVSALFDNATPVDYQDLIGCQDGAQTVGDNDAGSA